MSCPRKKEYIDINLNSVDLRQLKKGHTAHVVVKGIRYAIHSVASDPKSRKIARLLAEVNKLRSEQVKERHQKNGKRPYVKKDKEFWANGGNAATVMNKKKKEVA